MKTAEITFKHVGSWMLEGILERSAKLLNGRLIPRNGDPYLHRHYLQESDEFGVYLHKFESSDSPEEIHNHPWTWALAVILTNGYIEVRPKEELIIGQPCEMLKTRILFPFETNIITSNDFHSVSLIGGKPTWTLFIHGPRIKTWGFVKIATGEFREITARTIDKPETNNGTFMERFKNMIRDEIDQVAEKIFGEPGRQ